MKRKKIVNTLIICCFVLFVSFIYMKNNSLKVNQSEPISENVGYQEVVYEDEDHLLIPVQVAMQTVDENTLLQALITQMKTTSTHYPHLTSIFKNGLDVVGMTLQDQVLTLDFNDQLMNLNQEEAIRLLEALTWTFCHQDFVQAISLTCNGQQISSLGNGKIALDKHYDQSLGINNFETSSAYLHKTSPLMVYGSKQIDQTEFYVPVTMRLDLQDVSIQEQVSLILAGHSVSSLVEDNKLFTSVKVLDGTKLQDGCLTVNLSDQILLDEASMDQRVNDLLVMSLRQIKGVETVSFEVNGQKIGQDEKVSKTINYNRVKM